MLVVQSCPTLCNPMYYSLPYFSVHGILHSPGKNTGWSGWPFPSPGDLSDLVIKHWFPALQTDSLPSELPQKCTGQHLGRDLEKEEVNKP